MSDAAAEPRSRSLLARLTRAPRRFRFDAAVRILTRAAGTDDPSAAIRFRTPPGLAFPAADILDIRRGDRKPEVTTGLMGLTGPSGVLPRAYSETVTRTVRGRSTALHEFLDMLADRFVGFFARAGVKYRPARNAEAASRQAPATPDPVTQVLLALTGYGTAGLSARLPTGPEPVLHYAGLFALRPRSAERLAAMLSDWLRMKVEVVEYAGAWLALPPDQRTRIGADGVFCQLGVDAAAGVRAWNPEARILLRVGPLSRDGFERLLPDGAILYRLVSLVRAFVGIELGFAVNPVLAAAEIAPLRLDSRSGPPPRLGWNTWLPIAGGSATRPADAADAVFDADMVEAWTLANRRAA